MKDIKAIARKLGLTTEQLIFYGNHIAKVKAEVFTSLPRKGKLILVTAINPTKAGEGKTTSAIGIADLMNHLNYSVVLALREPSLGPVFGLKGAATGGGECIIVPEPEINLHFTGDFHAITSANNLVSAVIDNILYWNNSLAIDPNKIIWQRCLDINDRALRNVTLNLGHNIVRSEHFQITAASEIMAILSLSKNLADLEERLNDTIVAYNFQQEPIYLKELKISGSIMALLKDAIRPNLVQTKYHTPAFVHCGPFANISHGTNSLIATDLALKLADYVVTETGFGSDLGFEKFNDIINLQQEYTPACTVLVVTIRALKLHGGMSEEKLDLVDLITLQKGFDHLNKHINIIKQYNLPFVVCINKFSQDDASELKCLEEWLVAQTVSYAINTTYQNGVNADSDLVNKIIAKTREDQEYQPLFNPQTTTVTAKILTICQKIYGVEKVIFSEMAEKKLNKYNASDFRHWPVCMAKNHQTISGNNDGNDNAISVRDVKINSGAKYFIIYLSDIITLPGLNRTPNANNISLIDDKIINIK
ncbi:formate--tetrahydrofolate ligase [Spiroplasma chrysopicola]|uniref:Formate--tetrahydrofolate ligase n=1 Tax=Spiroplasma chrysopicola DF-1 TaxID=1276227 RepID=R4U3U7_9MOLU|nr:formate--tetrahydrofolate ligase [Spiroplasma chrysopicola]AGM25173.1 formate--tetrahydrofolate ligase [Spiroplasma chrysopicola DF-1]